MKKITLSLLLIIAFPFLQKVVAQTKSKADGNTITVVICRHEKPDTVLTFVIEGVCQNTYPADMQPPKKKPDPKQAPMKNRSAGYVEDKTKFDY